VLTLIKQLSIDSEQVAQRYDQNKKKSVGKSVQKEIVSKYSLIFGNSPESGIPWFRAGYWVATWYEGGGAARTTERGRALEVGRGGFVVLHPTFWLGFLIQSVFFVCVCLEMNGWVHCCCCYFFFHVTLLCWYVWDSD